MNKTLRCSIGMPVVVVFLASSLIGCKKKEEEPPPPPNNGYALQAAALCKTLASAGLGKGGASAQIAAQMKGANLTPTVGKKLVASNRPNGHLVHIFGRLVFAEDFRALGVAEFAGFDPRLGGC